MTRGMRKSTEPREELLVVVGWRPGRGPNRLLLHGHVTADTGLFVPDPPISAAEMSAVAFAAKMALCKVLRQRKASTPRPRPNGARR